MIITRAILSKYKKETKDLQNVSVDADTSNKYISTLTKMLQKKTIFTDDNKYNQEFIDFYDVLAQEFPLIHSKGEVYNLEGCLLVKISASKDKNILLMSHHDVVEDSPNWKFPAFSGEISDGKIYARGSIDTKTPLFAEFQAVEELLSEGHVFDANIYIASSNNEEVSGDGIFFALDYFKKNNIHFDFLLDEGGAIVDKMVPGVKEKIAMIAVHEKSRHSFKCTANKDISVDGGHSGLTCKIDNPITRMSKFIAEISDTKWTSKLHSEVKGTFSACAPYMPFGLRLVFANISIFQKLLVKIIPKLNPAAKDMVGTTVYFTQNKSTGGSDNIIAKKAESFAFFRCVREEDLQKDLIKFNKIAEKYGIEIESILRDYCKPTSIDCKQFGFVKKTIQEIFPSTVVAPFLLTAGTDARRLGEVTDAVLRFAPINLSKEQFATVHSDNENIDISSIGSAVCFYKTLIKNMKSF